MICKLGKKLDGQNVQFMKEISKYPRGPNTQSTLSSFLIKFGLYLSREKKFFFFCFLQQKYNENKQKEAGFGTLKKI